MLKKLKQIYFKEQFNPSFIGVFIHPFFFARRGLYKHIRSIASFIKGKTLDVGCGSKPYEKLYQSTEYIGLEMDTEENRQKKKADFFYDGSTFPFRNEEFESVVANQVFEHVFNPDRFLSEVNRILKLNGYLLLTVPFVWDEHEQPYDYARYSSFGLQSILNKQGFTVQQHKKSIHDIRIIFQLINMYIFKQTNSKYKLLNIITTFFLMAPFNIVGSLIYWIFPGNKDLYLDNIVLAQKIKNV